MGRQIFKRTDRRRERAASIRKSMLPDNADEILESIDNYVEHAIEEPVRLLVWAAEHTSSTILYSDLIAVAQGVTAGRLLFAEWQQAYIERVNTILAPHWRRAAEHGARASVISRRLVWDADTASVRRFIGQRSMQLVTAIHSDQRSALASILDIANSNNLTTSQIAQQLRSVIGLHRQQQLSNARYFAEIKQSLMADHPEMTEAAANRLAHQAAQRFAQRQQRSRAYTIAQTEMAAAYNWGAQEGTRLAVEQGLLEISTKTWITARDERTCPVCGRLDGMTIPINEKFKHPEQGYEYEIDGHAHPLCRCAVAYNEET